jgi:hypothetical protein
VNRENKTKMSDAPTSRTPQHSAQKFECKKEPGLENKKIVGIDLGTTFSSVGIWKNDDVEIRPNSEG